MSGERRTLQNYAYWSSRKTHQSPAGPRPTLGALQRSSSWWWLYCEQLSALRADGVSGAGHSDAPGDVLRQCARCTVCGHKGATLQHPSWGGNGIGFLPFPADA
jgi:hypothetical protein